MHRSKTAPAGTANRWFGLLRPLRALAACALLSACGSTIDDNPLFCFECEVADSQFYALTTIVLSPDSTPVRAGTTVTSDVTLVYPGKFDDGDSKGDAVAFYHLDNLSIVMPLEAGLQASLSDVTSSPCADAEVPPGWVKRSDFICARARLSVTADVDALQPRAVVLSAQWTRSELQSQDGGVIEQIGSFTALSADTVGFQLAVGADPAGSYATVTSLPVSITQTGTAQAPVTLAFDAMASDITGTFSANPVAAAAATLLLNIPAHYAEGGLVPLRITGSSDGGRAIASKAFTLRIDPLFAVTLAPATGIVSSAAPLDIQVTLTFSDTGPFATAPPAIDLSTTTLAPGLAAVFLPDATPVAFTAGRTIARTLRLSTDGSTAATGSLGVIATASAQPADLGGRHPYIDRTLDLQLVGAPQWQYIENGASYVLTDSDVVGIAMQTNNLPAIAWVEGRAGTPATPTRPAIAGTRQVYVKRFNGTTFVASPSPGPANALVAPSGDIDEARFALSRSDVAKIAFTFNDGAGIALGSAGTSWSVNLELVAGGVAHVRSPRIATGAGDAALLSYIVESDAQATASALFVTRSFGAAGSTRLPGPQPDGSLNRDPAGRVLRGTTALASRADGNPVVAWIEQSAGPTPTSALWVRAYDGAAWGSALAVPVSPALPLVPGSVQLAVEPAGTVVVSWLEGSPARLMVARGDLASASWLALTNTNNGQGSLNDSTTQSARDVSLAIDALGRIVVAWTEGGVRPQLRVKRQNADTTWSQLGPVIDRETTRTPRIVSDANALLYLNYTRFYHGDDLLAPRPDTDIFVVRWQSP